jgi:hypothetical protein
MAVESAVDDVVHRKQVVDDSVCVQYLFETKTSCVSDQISEDGILVLDRLVLGVSA